MRLARISGVATITWKHVRAFDHLKRLHGGVVPREQAEQMMASWSSDLLDLFRVEVKTSGNLDPGDGPFLYVGNHISYMDIPVILSQFPVRFVAKSELKNWPILKSAFTRADVIFVERESQNSRKQTVNVVGEALKQGKSVCLFPSGTTDISESKPWKRGAFHLAKELNVPIRPFRIRYEPLREVAYIGDDNFLTHIYALAAHKKIVCEVELDTPKYVESPQDSADALQAWTQIFVSGK